MILNSFSSLGCALGSPGVLRGASKAREEFSKFPCESELSTSAYSDDIWPTGKLSKNKKKKVVENICVFLSKVDRASFSRSTGVS